MRGGAGLWGRLAGTVVAVLLLLAAGASAVAQAEELSPAEIEKLPQIEEWIYRNGAVKDPLSCGEVCENLWTAEHGSMLNTPGSQELWDQLGRFESSDGLWSPVARIAAIPGASLGHPYFKIGWTIEGGNSKWLELGTSTEASERECQDSGEQVLEIGMKLTPSEPAAFAPATAYYVTCIGEEDELFSSERCNHKWVTPGSGWSNFVWNGGLCYVGPPKEYIQTYERTYYRPFHYARPVEWNKQVLNGENTMNTSTGETSDPGTTVTKERLKSALESDSLLNAWLKYELFGEGRNPTQSDLPAEEYGAENPAKPEQPHCFAGDPVNCATGDRVETQRDLAVGGRGLGLTWTRSYNSQLAVNQGTHGPLGYGWTSSYSAHVEINEEKGEATVYQDGGATVKFVLSNAVWRPAAPLVQATLAKEGSTYVYTLPNQTKLSFNSAGQLTSETDRNGNTLTMNRNAEGRLESISDPSGRKLTLTYNSEQEIESVADPMGHTVKYAYEGGNLASVTEPGESSPNWRFKYDTSHELTETTDSLSHTSTTEYDSSHRAISQTDALKHTRKWKYSEPSSGEHETVITEPNGSETVELFNGPGLPIRVTRAAGTSLASATTFEYNGTDNLIALGRPEGRTTSYTYNSAGDRTSATDPLGHITKWEYNSTHDVISTTAPNGETTTIKRESHGNPEAIERPAPGGKTQVTKYKYTSHGELESVTNPLEHTWKYEYDPKGDRTVEIDPEGNKRTWEYNEDSQETATVSPRGNVKEGEASKFTTKIERDTQGRPLKVTDPLAHTTEYKYNGDGDVEKITDGNKHTTTYTYNGNNQPIKVEEPNKAVTETEYDNAGQVIAQIDGNKRKTKYTRNALEEVTEVTDPLGHVTTKEYDGVGNLIKLTDPAKRTTTYTYDLDSHLVEASYSSGKPSEVRYEYNEIGERTNMIDGTGTTTYTYDQLGRMTEAENGHKEVTKYEYDLANDQTKITYPSGKAVTRAFDKDGRLEKITDWLEHATKIAYDQDSHLKTITFPSETKNEDKYTYNNADQMTEAKMVKGSETLASLLYTRDNNGQLKKTTSKGLPGAEVTESTYDENNRITKTGSTEYKYDAANNPTKEGSSTNTYNEGDELEKGTSVSYSYDELGERTKTTPEKGPATTYGYDQAGNLTSVTRLKEGEITAIEDSYAYNGEGLRTSQTISGTTSYLAWDMAEELPLILSDGTNSYIYGPSNMPVEQINNEGKPLYLHHDQAGSARLITGSTGTIEGAYTYTAYGALQHTGTATTPLGYDGQYTSSDTGLIYLRKRIYDPATAQFLSIDPVVGLTRAPYNYTLDNPLNFSDPNGLITVGTCIHVGGLFGEVVGYQGQACAVVSSSGEFGITAGGGPTVSGGIGAIDVGPSGQVSNANNIPQLYGPFAQGGGSTAFGIGGFGDAFTGRDSCGEQISGGNVGISAGIGAEVHLGPTETVGASVNVPSLLKEVYEFPANAIKEIDSGL